MISRELLELMADDDYTFWANLIKSKDIPYDFLNYLSENVTGQRLVKNVRLGLQKGIKIEWIKLYANTYYSEYQISEILEGLEYCKENESKLELVKLYFSKRFEGYQMEKALDAIKNDLSKSDIILLCNAKLTWTQICDLYDDLLKKHRTNSLYEIISSYNEEEPSKNSMMNEENN